MCGPLFCQGNRRTTKAGGPREALVSVSMAVSDAVRTASLSVWARAIILKPCGFCLESAACEGDTPGSVRALAHKPRLTPARAVLCSLECTRQVVAGRWRTCVPPRRVMRRSSTFVMRERVRATRASNPSHIARACGCSALCALTVVELSISRGIAGHMDIMHIYTPSTRQRSAARDAARYLFSRTQQILTE